MERINSTTVLPGQHEIMPFGFVFGNRAGDQRSSRQSFGVRQREGKPNVNPVAVCMELEQFDHTEHALKFNNYNGWTTLIAGHMALIMSTKPWAELGDPENIAEMEYGHQKQNAALVFFVNDKDEDPDPEARYIHKYVRDENGGYTMKKVKVAGSTKYWLKPYTTYYLTLRRIGASIQFGQDRNHPMSLYVGGSGDPENEVHLDVTDLVGDIAGYPMDLGPLGTGLFIPD